MGFSILVNPMSSDFDSFAALDSIWSPNFAAAHDRAVEASNSGESNPALVAIRSAIVTLQNLYHLAALRRHLLGEKESYPAF